MSTSRFIFVKNSIQFFQEISKKGCSLSVVPSQFSGKIIPGKIFMIKYWNIDIILNLLKYKFKKKESIRRLETKTTKSIYIMFSDTSENTTNKHFEISCISSDCNWTRTQNHLVVKRTLNHLAKLAVWPNGWVFV